MASNGRSDPHREAIRHVLKEDMEQIIPTVTMTVYYGNVKVINGSELKVNVVENAPRVDIGGDPNELYALVMIDPDAPNPNEPRLQQLVSWIVTNIPGGRACTEGTEVMPYDGPDPEIGVHRYLLVLYRQPKRLAIDTLASRVHFNVCRFANNHDLKGPVGLAYFNVRRQPKNPKTKA